MKRPAGATAIEVSFGDDVSIKWPSWDGEAAWDVWDSRGVRQGAVRHVTVKAFARACDLARRFANTSDMAMVKVLADNCIENRKENG